MKILNVLLAISATLGILGEIFFILTMCNVFSDSISNYIAAYSFGSMMGFGVLSIFLARIAELKVGY